MNTKLNTDTENLAKPLLAVVLFISWLKTLIWFYVFRKFRNLNYEQIEFLQNSFKPQNKRDARLEQTILNFNRSRLKNNG